MNKDIDALNEGDYVLGQSPFILDGWENILIFKNYVLSYSNKLNIVSYRNADLSITVLGLMYNPNKPRQNTSEILKELSQASNPDQLLKRLYPLMGCYVVLCFWKQGGIAVSDAASLRKIYYIEHPFSKRFFISSSATLLAEVNGCSVIESLILTKDPNTRIGQEGYLPGHLTHYEGIRHLIPHYYLLLSDMKPIRFFPKVEKKEILYSKGITKTAKIISGSAESILERFSRVSIAMTAGYDSRISLAAFAGCSEGFNKVETFTFKYPYLDEKHRDIRVAQEVAKQTRIKHCTIEVNVPQEAEGKFVEMFGMATPLVVSTIADIYRIFYRLPGLALKPNFIRKKEQIPKTHQALCALEEWFSFFNNRYDFMGYDVFDLYYWENRIARWGSKGFSGSDVKARKINIFNSNELLDTVLQIKPDIRRSGQFNRDLIELLYPGLTNIPFNPPQTVKDSIKEWLKNRPIEKWIRYFSILLKNT